MTTPIPTLRRARIFALTAAAGLAFCALAAMSSPAQAFWLGFGPPCCGLWGPGPYWGYPSPYAYYPPPAYYPPTAYPAPTAYPGAAPAAPAAPTAPGVTPTASAAVGTPQITYTTKPAFTNSAGLICREYKTTDASAGHEVFGTACRQADGQWRVAN